MLVCGGACKHSSAASWGEAPYNCGAMVSNADCAAVAAAAPVRCALTAVSCSAATVAASGFGDAAAAAVATLIVP